MANSVAWHQTSLARWAALAMTLLSVTVSPVTSFKTRSWTIDRWPKKPEPNWAQSCIEAQTYPCRLPNGTFPWGQHDYDEFINENVYSMSDVPSGSVLRELVKVYKKVKLSCIIGQCMGLGHRVSLTRTIPPLLYPSPSAPAAAPVVDTVMKVWAENFGSVEVKIFQPKARCSKLRRGVMYFHGGGWSTGSADGMYDIAYGLAELGNMVVVSVNYRLAPEHVFPAQLDDCLEATQYLMNNARRFGVDCNRIVVAGDSSGGSLAAGVSLKLRDTYRSGPKLKMQVLLYPALQAIDFRTPSYQKNVCDPSLDQAYMLSFYLWYAFGTDATTDFKIQDFATNSHTTSKAKKKYAKYVDWKLLPSSSYTSAQRREACKYRNGNRTLWNQVERVFTNTYFSPLLTAKTCGLPRAYIMAMDLDVLRDDSVMYAGRLQKGGVKVKLARCKGAHGMFNNMHMDYTKDELKKIVKYIVEYV